MKYRALIVEDEAPARANLARIVAQDERFEVVGQASDGVDGLQQIEALRPDLVLLDIQMPGCGGFEMLVALGDDRNFAVIFATAHDEYALRAFDAHAIDYVLKPYDSARIAQALDKAYRQILSSSVDHRAIAALASSAAIGERPHGRLVVRTSDGWLSLELDTIVRLSAQGKYVEVTAGAARHVVRSSLGKLAQRLPPDRFIRIHRGEIVRLSAISKFESGFHGDGIVSLEDDSAVPVSRTHRRALLERLQAQEHAAGG